jgi:hypothetical protein
MVPVPFPSSDPFHHCFAAGAANGRKRDFIPNVLHPRPALTGANARLYRWHRQWYETERRTTPISSRESFSLLAFVLPDYNSNSNPLSFEEMKEVVLSSGRRKARTM